MNTNPLTVFVRRTLTMGAVMSLSLMFSFLSGATAELPDFAAQHPTSLSIILSTNKSSYKLGSDILVTIAKRNALAVPLQTNVLAASIDYDVAIRHGSVKIEPCALGSRNFPVVEAPHRPYQLGPGAVVTDPGTNGNFSPISAWCLKVEEPGTYVLTAISRETKQESNHVTITVTA